MPKDMKIRCEELIRILVSIIKKTYNFSFITYNFNKWQI